LYTTPADEGPDIFGGYLGNAITVDSATGMAEKSATGYLELSASTTQVP
jgi:hypothetical protein